MAAEIAASAGTINGMVGGSGLNRAPLHNAAAWGGKDLVKLLLELGADPNLRDLAYHAAPIGWALYGGHRDVVEYLLPFASIFDAVQSGGIDRVRALLREHPSPANAQDDRGIPLVFYLHPDIARLEEMIQVLVTHGADLNARDNDGRTLLDRALARGLADFADMLRAHGAASQS